MRMAEEIGKVVFPTHVGMNRRLPPVRNDGAGIPHARGDEPKLEGKIEKMEAYSPRTWG